MERELMKDLTAWKDSPRRKPLILKGARQVGKTWLMKEFGGRCYKRTAYVNFDNNPAMKQVFRQDFDVSRILLAINAETGVRVSPEDTLIVFDEVQEAPLAISALKYFCENALEYSVIAAGIALHEGISYPVGKVSTMQLHPLSFHEFLNATGEGGLAGLLDEGDDSMLAAFHDRFVAALKNYYVVGGMPEVVDAFARTKDYSEVRRIQNDLLEMYEADFGKHVPGVELPRLRLTWGAIPAQLAKDNRKFFFGHVKKGGRAGEFEKAVKCLADCGLVARVHRVSKPAVPMKAYAEQNAYKLFFVDVGLLGAVSGLDVRSVIEGNRVFTEFKGALTEQYVCQELLSDRKYRPYYFTSDSGNYEIDFMVQQGEDIVPVEVKAEQNLRSKSLRAYCDKYSPAKAIRLSMQDHVRQDWLENIPLYAIRKYM